MSEQGQSTEQNPCRSISCENYNLMARFLCSKCEMERKKKIKPIRCPECRSVNIILTEHIESFTEWAPGEEDGYHSSGNYFKVTGACKECGHGWRLKNHIQVWDELKERLAENARLMKRSSK